MESLCGGFRSGKRLAQISGKGLIGAVQLAKIAGDGLTAGFTADGDGNRLCSDGKFTALSGGRRGRAGGGQGIPQLLQRLREIGGKRQNGRTAQKQHNDGCFDVFDDLLAPWCLPFPAYCAMGSVMVTVVPLP